MGVGDKQGAPLGRPVLDTWSTASTVLSCLLLGDGPWWLSLVRTLQGGPHVSTFPRRRGTLVQEDDLGLRQVGFAAGPFTLCILASPRLRLRI